MSECFDHLASLPMCVLTQDGKIQRKEDTQTISQFQRMPVLDSQHIKLAVDS